MSFRSTGFLDFYLWKAEYRHLRDVGLLAENNKETNLLPLLPVGIPIRSDLRASDLTLLTVSIAGPLSAVP